MQGKDFKISAENSAVINDFDLGGGLLVPSSFSRIDNALKEKIESVDGIERLALVLKACFGTELNFENLNDCDFPLVELEEDLFVLELESANGFKAVEEAKRPLLIAAVFASAYADLQIDGNVRLFLPYEYKHFDVLRGALLAQKTGVPFEVYVGAKEEDFDKCQKALKDANCIAISREAVKETMNNFNDYDDYVFDVASALGASAFECVEEEGDAPSVIVSVANPLENPLATLEAFDVKAKDEKDAIKKLKTLFAL
ncbi:MAG: hypothetical protein J5713_02185 [Clostridia bacterium]|nr:hypothetical protein [Clostridia bacterium]